MSITNATSLRKNLFSYLDAAAVNDEKIIVTTKSGNAVIISEEYLRSLEETCYLYSIPGMKDSIQEGINTPTSECTELDWRSMLK
ncbi:MAG: type II toxin-antitoxin system Phd/YefM family antitoxin [Clostridia bacterium]|nr:type II toxin-antitoxin system Phd/YefM family antitoxin [Clostridia bacterium]